MTREQGVLRDGVRQADVLGASPIAGTGIVRRDDAARSEVGRDYIIDQVRRYMEETPFSDFQRRDIAAFAGVTPAAISRHFRNKFDLVIEASGPILAQNGDEISRTLGSDQDMLIKLRWLTRNFISLGLKHGYMIEYFIAAVQSRNNSSETSYMAEKYMEINRFMQQVAGASTLTSVDASFLQSSLWGQCMYLARQPHLRQLVDASDRSNVIESLTSAVFDLLTRGLSIENQ